MVMLLVKENRYVKVQILKEKNKLNIPNENCALGPPIKLRGGIIQHLSAFFKFE